MNTSKAAPRRQSPAEVIDGKMMRIIFFGLTVIVAMVGLHQITKADTLYVPAGEVTDEAMVFIAAGPHGDISVRDSENELLVEYTASAGGLLTTLHTVIGRERLRYNTDPSEPVIFRIRDDTKLSLYDPSTGREYSLSSYGRDNVAKIRTLVLQ
ncbi:MAG: photosynthetic complex assembly protein PuhC [Pseudomonadota bacterium]